MPIINLLLPNAGQTTARIIGLLGLSAIVGGIIGWVSFDDDPLDVRDELVKPGRSDTSTP